MSRFLSIQRSEKLTDCAKDFLNFKIDFMNNRKNDIVLQNKKRIMEYLEANNTDWNDWHWQLRNRICGDAGSPGRHGDPGRQHPADRGYHAPILH